MGEWSPKGGAMGAVVMLGMLLGPLNAPGAAPDTTPARPLLVVPKVSPPPGIENFLSMAPQGEAAGRLAMVEGFIQRQPKDGQPSTQRTVVYLGYDDKHLYLIFVCFDSEPLKIRARMGWRESILGDDNVGVILDTYS
ncbi:MAG TPA: hypothetical protein VIH17_02940 [Candidatus Acidoferrales bacterium]